MRPCSLKSGVRCAEKVPWVDSARNSAMLQSVIDLTPRQYQTRFQRFRVAAERDAALLLKSLPPEVRQALPSPVPFRFEDRPSKEQMAKGTPDDAFSVVDRDTNTIVIYVMNLSAKCGMHSGGFRDELRRVMVHELQDWAGGGAGVGDVRRLTMMNRPWPRLTPAQGG